MNCVKIYQSSEPIIKDKMTESLSDKSDEDIDEGDSIDKNNIPDIEQIDLTSKEKYYFRMVNKFFKMLEPTNISLMIDIIDGKSKISLRLLDWFVTRYANKFKISYNFEDINQKIENENNRFNVHISYKAQLKSYKKRYFDPFRRRKKFNYYFNKDKTKILCTTIGQLNFFRWAFSNKLINYVDDHYETISKAMIISNKEDKNRKLKEKTNKGKTSSDSSTQKIKIKKNGINIVAKKNAKQNEIKIVLSFD